MIAKGENVPIRLNQCRAKKLGLKMNVQLTGLQEVFGRDTFQILPNLMVKSQAIDISEVI